MKHDREKSPEEIAYERALEFEAALNRICPLGEGANYARNMIDKKGADGEARTWSVSRSTKSPRDSRFFIETRAESGLIYEYVRYVINPNSFDAPFMREGVPTIQSWEIATEAEIDTSASIGAAIALISQPSE